MKVNKIKEYIESFKKYLNSGSALQYSFFQETIVLWDYNWDISSEDLAVVYDKSLINNHTARLWGGSRDSGKSVMMAMIKKNPEMMKVAFLDLFSHEKDIGLRIGRFIHYCDEVLEEIRESTNLINAHYHNKALISVYLTLEDPQRYCLYDFPTFYKCMTKLESLKIPSEHETERYYKSLTGIMNLCRRDEEMMSLYSLKSGNSDDVPFIFINDFMEFVVHT